MCLRELGKGKEVKERRGKGGGNAHLSAESEEILGMGEGGGGEMVRAHWFATVVDQNGKEND